MNVERLREAVDLLLLAEDELNVQSILQTICTQLQQLASNPQDINLQTQFTNSLDTCRETILKLHDRFTPAQMSLFSEIKATEKFFGDFVEEIEKSMQENPITPTVTLNRLNLLVSDRATYLARSAPVPPAYSQFPIA